MAYAVAGEPTIEISRLPVIGPATIGSLVRSIVAACLGLGAFQWMDRLLRTFPGNPVGIGSDPPAESEITARLAYVAMTATTSKLAANIPRLRVNGGAFFASPHRIIGADPLLRLQHC